MLDDGFDLISSSKLSEINSEIVKHGHPICHLSGKLARVIMEGMHT